MRQIKFEPSNPLQDAFLWSACRETVFDGGVANGKLLSLDTAILTLDGWSTMEKLESGDTVFDEQGEPCLVTSCSPVQYPVSYKIRFDDNSEILAGEEHQWLTFSYAERRALHRRNPEFRSLRRFYRNKTVRTSNRVYKIKEAPKGSIRTTRQILDTLLAKRGKQLNHSIPLCKPIRFRSSALPLHGYVLGAWLGDGDSASGMITSADTEVIDLIRSLGWKVIKRKQKYRYRIEGLTALLRKMGVLGNKHIPEKYLLGDRAERMDLLQGLMDTDGSCSKQGQCEFTNTNYNLASGVYDLAVSMGLKPTILKAKATLNGRIVGDKWRVIWTGTLQVFSIPRKEKRIPRHPNKRTEWRYIKSVEPIPSIPMRCISVDSPSHLYLAGRNLVPTHNSTGGIARLLTLASRFAGSRWVVFRQEYKTLVSTTRKTFEKVVPSSWVKRDVQETTDLINDSQIHWMHMDAMDEKSLRSLEINGAFGDQIEEIHPEMWELMGSRIGRWQLPQWGKVCPPYLWGTCNPEGHDWVYYRFHPEVVKYPTVEYYPITQEARDFAKRFGRDLNDADRGIRAFSKDRMYLFGNTLVNLSKLNEIEPSYVANLLKKPKSWQDKWVFGNRQIFEGMIHKDWNQNIHVYDPTTFDPFKARTIRSIDGFYDHGQSSPSCLLLFANDAEGFRWCFFEYYSPYKSIPDHAKKILEHCGNCTMKPILYGDPSMMFETKDPQTKKIIRPSTARDYNECGVFFLAADNNQELGIDRINDLLQVKQDLWNPVTREQGSPKLFVSKSCPNVIEQIPQQRWKNQRNLVTGENEFIGEREEQIPDHAYDPLLYKANSISDYVPYTGPIKTHSTSYGARP